MRLIRMHGTRLFLVGVTAAWFGLGLMAPAFSWAARPFLSTERADPIEKGQSVLESGFLYQQFTSNDHLSMLLFELTDGILNDLDFKVDVPVLFFQSGSAGENGLGDVNLKLKARLLRAREGRPVTLATQLHVKLPTCNKDRLASYNPSCTGKTDLGITGIASKTYRSVTVHLNFGYTMVGGDTAAGSPPTGTRPLRDTLNYSLAFEYLLSQLPLTLSAELSGHTSSDPGDSINPLTALAAATYHPNQAVSLDLGVGRGVTNAGTSPAFAISAGMVLRF
ncbi:MAG: transporter [Nitrospirae bacterium]|nr:transporter [Nitrospirota bacterium]